MSKPIALIGSLGSTTKLTDLTSLQAAEMETMCRICEDNGYEALVAEGPPSERARAPRFPTGRAVWNGEGEIDLVWIHQQPPNYPGGPNEKVCENIQLLSRGLSGSGRLFRLVLDNNTTMRHKSAFGFGRRTECEAFIDCANHLKRKAEEGLWFEVGYKECADPDAGMPFIECGISARQLDLTLEMFGTDEEKTIDFCYIGTSRANKKKQEARLDSIRPFLDYPDSHFSGSLFRKKCGFVKGWELMREARAHLIVRDAGMDQTPLHRYLQALVHGAIPIVLNEPTPVAFIHNEVLQDALRVTSLEEALDLISRRDELMPLLIEEKDYWMEFDWNRGPRLP